MTPDFLTNEWINHVASKYSEAMILLPVALTALFKLLAILDPKVPSSKLIDWVQTTFYKSPKIDDRGHARLRTLFALVALLAAFLLLSGFIRPQPERIYQERWCKAMGGSMEVVLDDGARVDCVTKDYAVEVDFAPKWAESIGQSLYYALALSKQPAVLLIVDKDKDYRFTGRLRRVARKYHIKVYTVEAQ